VYVREKSEEEDWRSEEDNNRCVHTSMGKK
jgi:hypothetical protein